MKDINSCLTRFLRDSPVVVDIGNGMFEIHKATNTYPQSSFSVFGNTLTVVWNNERFSIELDKNFHKIEGS